MKKSKSFVRLGPLYLRGINAVEYRLAMNIRAWSETHDSLAYMSFYICNGRGLCRRMIGIHNSETWLSYRRETARYDFIEPRFIWA